MNFFEYDAELSISTQVALDYYDNFSKNWKRNLWMIKRPYKNPKRAAHHGLPFGSYITLTDMVRSSLETT